MLFYNRLGIQFLTYQGSDISYTDEVADIGQSKKILAFEVTS